MARLRPLLRVVHTLGVVAAMLTGRGSDAEAAPVFTPLQVGTRAPSSPGNPDAARPIDDFAKRGAARILGGDGLKLFQARKYAEALDKLERANRLVRAPTLELHIARCHEKLGHLVLAHEMYVEASRFPLDRTSSQAYFQAVRSAELEREVLQPRVPRLRVLVSGPHGVGLTVTLDDRLLPPELLDSLMPVDPGKHVVVVKRADITLLETADIAEATSARVQLRLPPLPEGADPGPAGRAQLEAERWQTLAITAYAIGAGGLIAAGVNGGIAVSKESELLAACPDRACPPTAHGDADVYDATRYATTAGLVLGGLGVAAGSALLLFAPDPPNGERPSGANARGARPWLGLGQVGVMGRF